MRRVMGLSGTLHTMPLVDLFQWLQSASKTGTLSVRGVRHTKKVYFKEGRIISSASDDPTEQLGQFLLSHGCITEDQLRKGLETQARSHVLLGKILLMVGAVKEDDLARLLVRKAEETIFSLFLWNDAHFDFDEDELPDGLFVPISLDVQDVLLKGLTLSDELRHIRAELGSMRSVVGRTVEPFPPDALADRPFAKAVMGLVDGKRSIADICLGLHASEFAVCQVLYQLHEERLIKIVEKVGSEPGSAGPTDPATLTSGALSRRGEELLTKGDFESAVEMLQKAASASPRDLQIRQLFEEARIRFRDAAYAEHLPPTKVPSLVRDLKHLTGETLTPEEVFLISRINGSWDLKSIIDISPLGEVEALLIMKRLKDRGIIVLR